MAAKTNPSSDVNASTMKLPNELRTLLHAHFDELRAAYTERGWGARVGFGSHPAIVVVDLALGWTQPDAPAGSQLDAVVAANVTLLNTARAVGIPIYFTTGHVDRSEPPAPVLNKFDYPADADFEDLFSLDKRLGQKLDPADESGDVLR